MVRPALIVHGGAGNRPAGPGATQRAGCTAAVEAGWRLLRDGGTAVDAVCAAVASLENDPAFNAGHGSCLTSAGTVEMDASIMDGHTLHAGAVAVVRGVPNPVHLARAIMRDGRHLMFAGPAAEQVARELGIETCPPQALITEPQRLQWLQSREGTGSAAGGPATGTVGAAAVDRRGHLAAATSTGGVLDKLPGRVGDAPLIGVGTYADNRTCAVSCTGWGEFFIRTVVAYDISAQMAYQGKGLAKAAQASLDKALKLGGGGGLVAIDGAGHVTMPFNTPGMFRAFHLAGAPVQVKLFGED